MKPYKLSKELSCTLFVVEMSSRKNPVSEHWLRVPICDGSCVYIIMMGSRVLMVFITPSFPAGHEIL